MKISFATLSDAGPRSVNEDCLDCWVAGSGETVACVADGLGGMGGGDVASRLAVESFRQHVDEHGVSAEIMTEAARTAHGRICAAQRQDIGCYSMATTLTAAVLSSKGLAGVHCGDSRAVLIRGEEIRQLSKDHSEAQRLFDVGKINEDDFFHHKTKHILESALGVAEHQGGAQIDSFCCDLVPGDRVLLTTDGVHDLLLPREMRQPAATAETVMELVRRMKDMIEERGAQDNYSMVALLCESVE